MNTGNALRLGQVDDAIKSYERAREINPDAIDPPLLYSCIISESSATCRNRELQGKIILGR